MTTRVAIYARVSTGEQSPEAQLRELRHYAEHRGFPITREYVDQASGDVRKRRRAPEFETLNGVVDMSLVTPPLPFTLPQRQQARRQTTEASHV